MGVRFFYLRIYLRGVVVGKVSFLIFSFCNSKKGQPLANPLPLHHSSI